jgi:RNA polymerase sigma-70 factor
MNKHLETLFVQAYAGAYDCHGDLGLNLEEFATHLNSIIEKRMWALHQPASAPEFINSLHINDLYLTLSCARGGEVAWSRFISLYNEFIYRTCRHACPSIDAAKERAGGLPGKLFLPGETGRSRIASYEGLCSLAAWLVVVIRRLTEKDRKLKSNNLESIDRISDLVDEASIFKIEAAMWAGRYGALLRDSVESAIGLLTDRERTIVSLRYEQHLQVSQVARLFGVRPSSITKQLDRTRHKLRKEVASILATRYGLGPAVIQECMAEYRIF